MERILVVNVNWVGDVIFSSPIFKALKEAYPKAQVSCLAVPRVRQVLESIPYIDEIIVYDEDGRHRNPLAKLKLIFQLRRKRFNIAFLLHRSLTRALLVYLAGIPQRVGYDEKNRGKFLTHKVEFLDEPVHRSDRYLNVIESYGVPVNDRRCQLSVSENAKRDIRGILKSKDINESDYLVVVNPGGNWDLKRWPARNFSLLIRGFLVDRGVKVVISGAQKDVSFIKEMNGLTPHGAVSLAGQTNLKQLIALMERADLVVSADSGPLHLASSVGSDVIGLFGPTRPEVTGPRGGGQVFVLQHDVGCNQEPCYYLQCSDNTCMKSITVDDVSKIIKQIRD